MNNEYDKLMGVFQSLFGNMLANSDMVQSSQFGDFVSSGKRIVLIWGDGAVGSLTDKTFACDQGAVSYHRCLPTMTVTHPVDRFSIAHG